MWKKIMIDEGYSISYAIMWNPETNETKQVCIFDMNDPRNENEEVRNMSLDEKALEEYRKKHGIIVESCKVKVIKGRTLPIGYTGIVKSIKSYTDNYGRWIADYVYFTSGEKINIKNCVRIG